LLKIKIIQRTIIYILLILSLVLGGMTNHLRFAEMLGFITGILLFLYTWNFTKGEILLPKGFKLFVVFLVLLFLNVLWSGHKASTREYFVNFVTSGLLWISVFNLRQFFLPRIDKLIVVAGVFFSVFFFISYFSGINVIDNGWSFFSYNPASNHMHLGDLWVIIAILCVYWLKQKFRWRILPLLGISIFLLAISLSRSAYLALGVGLFYLYFQKVKPGWIVKISILIIPVLFIFASFSKSIFSARPYFIQGLQGIINRPFGVGMGNFFEISRRYFETKLTTIAHNLILEVFVGMGIFGLVFVGWLTSIVVDIIRSKGKSGLVYAGIFFAILANFMFDTTYTIPTMLWIWFMSLGLAQPSKEIKT